MRSISLRQGRGENGLTETSDNEGYEIPCFGSDGLGNMEECGDSKEGDEYYCGGRRGVVVVEYESSLWLWPRHDLRFRELDRKGL